LNAAFKLKYGNQKLLRFLTAQNLGLIRNGIWEICDVSTWKIGKLALYRSATFAIKLNKFEK
jgi:hypothetical protein